MASPFLSDLQAISLGQANEAGMKHLHWYNYDLFKDYATYVDSEFVPYESRRLSGARRYKPMGLPTCKWKFPYFDASQVGWWITNYFASGTQDVGVTIRTLDTSVNAWYNYSAYLSKPEFHTFLKTGNYYDVVMEFYDLRRL